MSTPEQVAAKQANAQLSTGPTHHSIRIHPHRKNVAALLAVPARQKCSDELRKLRNEKRKAQIGFASQKRQQGNENRKQELHTWAVSLAQAKLTHQQILKGQSGSLNRSNRPRIATPMLDLRPISALPIETPTVQRGSSYKLASSIPGI